MNARADVSTRNLSPAEESREKERGEVRERSTGSQIISTEIKD